MTINWKSRNEDEDSILNVVSRQVCSNPPRRVTSSLFEFPFSLTHVIRKIAHLHVFHERILLYATETKYVHQNTEYFLNNLYNINEEIKKNKFSTQI